MFTTTKIYGLLICALTFVATQASAQKGYVQEETIKVPGILNDTQIYGLNLTQKTTTITYVDGLGRGQQTIAVQGSPLQNDLIQTVVYDATGQQTTSYLPYAGKSADAMGSYRPNAISTDQPAFYNNTGQHLIATDASPYSSQVMDNSPLQRMLQSGMVGSGFQPGVSGSHYKTISYRYNNSTDGNILIWNTDGTFTANNCYAANTLAITDGKDEDNTETLTFTDLAGHLILKRQLLNGNNLDTYYIYNNAGMPAYIVPPLATNKLADNNYNLSVAPLSNLVFKFIYDTMGRLVEKTVPAKGTMYIVYDPLNRPVLMQDNNLQGANKWNYIKYDAKGRAVSQGFYIDATHIGRVNMQAFVNTLTSSYNAQWYEARTATLTNGGYYTSYIFPTSVTGTLTPLAYLYYDDYDINQDGTADYSYTSQGLPNEETATTAQVKGMPTVVTKATVGAGLSNVWLTTVTFYDKRGNAIQVKSNNQLYYINSGTLTDTKTVVPDFMGVVQVTQVSKQTASATSVTVQTSMSYDHMYRLKTVSQQYNGGAVTQTAAYNYNELGQVILKNLGKVASGAIPADLTLSGAYTGTNTIIATNSIHSTGFSVPSGSYFHAFISTGYLQSVDYRYNIRGQLLSINNSKLNNDGGITNADATDLFGMQFSYDQADVNLGNSPYYNGKMSAVKWMSKDANGTSSYERAFSYSYDGVNRYAGETYAERTVASTGAFNNNLNGFDERVTGYDVAGNILHLNRNSSTQGTNTNTQIDNLTYNYDTNNPNRLLTVTDATGNAAGFNNYTGSTNNYGYDGNGNLNADPYKGLSLTYDDLNRTDKITMTYQATNRWIDYTYDASGNLLRKRQFDNNNLQTTTDYIGGFVYVNSTLSYFPMPEGRVLNLGGALKQEFVITDQQGNARISFQDSGTGRAIVKQENSYYGFGLIMGNSPVPTPSVPNKQLYNGGSEWQNDFSNLPDYYQTLNRNYDAAIGRFMAVDPVAESAADMTVYQYAGNNPIMYNDPLGDVLNYNDYVGRFGFFDGTIYGPHTEYVDTKGDNNIGGKGTANQWVAKVNILLGKDNLNGGILTSSGTEAFESQYSTIIAGLAYVNYTNSWEHTATQNEAGAISYFNANSGYNIGVNDAHQYFRTTTWGSYENNIASKAMVHEIGELYADKIQDIKTEEQEEDVAAIGLIIDSQESLYSVAKIFQKAPAYLEGASRHLGVVGAVFTGGVAGVNLWHSWRKGNIGSARDWVNLGIGATSAGLIIADPAAPVAVAVWNSATAAWDGVQIWMDSKND